MSTVLIVDDAELFQQALAAAFVQEGFEVVDAVSNPMDAIDATRRRKPDVVLLDVLMPGMSGLEILGALAKASPSSKVVMLTSSTSTEDLLAGIKGGAVGYVTKDTPLPRLVAAVTDVVEGGAAITPKLAVSLFATVRDLLRHRDVAAVRPVTLTGRELEILGHVSRGKTSRDIGELLYISENTVKNHVRNILDKLGLRSRFEAVRWAEREGHL